MLAVNNNCKAWVDIGTCKNSSRPIFLHFFNNINVNVNTNLFPNFRFKPFAELSVSSFSHTKEAFSVDKWFTKTFTKLYKEIQIVNEMV